MALSEENILGSFLPTVNISKIILNNTRVDLELVIIDTNFNEGIFSILNDKFLRDCITVKVYQSLNSQETDSMELGEEPGINQKFVEIPLNNNTVFEEDDEVLIDFQTKVLPLFTHVNFEFVSATICPTLLHFSPALGDAAEAEKVNEEINARAINRRRKFFTV